MKLYEQSNANIWTDPHIQMELLNAHLDVSTDAASRNIPAIDKTIKWTLSDFTKTGKALDLGCGPGLYSEKLASLGWDVVGIDINKTSIDFAINSAKTNNLPIQYINSSYLDDFDGESFDLAMCIYCDFGALTQNQQACLLKTIHNKIKLGGTLVFDVFGEGISQTKKTGRSWERFEQKSFWSSEPCYLLSEIEHFASEMIWGQKYVLIPDAGEQKTFVVWDHYFTAERITKFTEGFGFEVAEISSTLIDANQFTTNDVMFVKAIKSRE